MKKVLGLKRSFTRLACSRSTSNTARSIRSVNPHRARLRSPMADVQLDLVLFERRRNHDASHHRRGDLGAVGPHLFSSKEKTPLEATARPKEALACRQWSCLYAARLAEEDGDETLSFVSGSCRRSIRVLSELASIQASCTRQGGHLLGADLLENDRVSPHLHPQRNRRHR